MMISERLVALSILFAQRSPFNSLGNSFRGRRARFDLNDVVVGLMLLGIAALVIFVLSRLLARQEKQKPFHSPRALFAELCRAHELDRPSRRLLKRLARFHKLPQPAMLFLEPAYFDPQKTAGSLGRDRSQLVNLREKLFARSRS